MHGSGATCYNRPAPTQRPAFIKRPPSSTPTPAKTPKSTGQQPQRALGPKPCRTQVNLRRLLHGMGRRNAARKMAAAMMAETCPPTPVSGYEIRPRRLMNRGRRSLVMIWSANNRAYVSRQTVVQAAKMRWAGDDDNAPSDAGMRPRVTGGAPDEWVQWTRRHRPAAKVPVCGSLVLLPPVGAGRIRLLRLAAQNLSTKTASPALQFFSFRGRLGCPLFNLCVMVSTLSGKLSRIDDPAANCFC